MTLMLEAAEDLYKSEINVSKKGAVDVEIETPRLFIRSYKDEDFENSLELYGNTKNTKFFDHGQPRSRQEVLKLVQEKTGYFKKGQPFGIFSLFLKDKKTFIGQIDLIPSDKPGVVEIGMILLPQYQNRGYSAEGVRVFLRDYVRDLNAQGYSAEGSQIKEVMATVHPENLPSKKLIEKMGMHFKKFQNRFGAPRLWYTYKLPEFALPMQFSKILSGSRK